MWLLSQVSRKSQNHLLLVSGLHYHNVNIIIIIIIIDNSIINLRNEPIGSNASGQPQSKVSSIIYVLVLRD